MRTGWIVIWILAMMVGSLWVKAANAQTERSYQVLNEASEKLKICFYRSSDKTWINPIRCQTTAAGTAFSLRLKVKDNISSVDIRVFRPAILDKLLCQRRRIKVAYNVTGFYYYGKNPCLKPINRRKEALSKLEVGDKILANWRNDTYWYPATIYGIVDSNYQIRYADGSTETLNSGLISDDHIRAGTRVSGNWLGKGRWYPGTIASRDGNSVKINYDDGDKEMTTLSRIRLAYSDLPLRPEKYMMRVCNRIDERVYFAISFGTDQATSNYRTEGWWNVNPNGCINVDLSKRWKMARIPENLRSRTYIYGETKGILGGAIKKTWEADHNQFAFCVDLKKGPYFKNARFQRIGSTMIRNKCEKPNQEIVRMSEVPFPASGTSMGFNFTGQ